MRFVFIHRTWVCTCKYCFQRGEIDCLRFFDSPNNPNLQPPYPAPLPLLSLKGYDVTCLQKARRHLDEGEKNPFHQSTWWWSVSRGEGKKERKEQRMDNVKNVIFSSSPFLLTFSAHQKHFNGKSAGDFYSFHNFEFNVEARKLNFEEA